MVIRNHHLQPEIKKTKREVGYHVLHTSSGRMLARKEMTKWQFLIGWDN